MSVYCYRCGQRLANGSRHCPGCGAGIFYDENGPRQDFAAGTGGYARQEAREERDYDYRQAHYTPPYEGNYQSAYSARPSYTPPLTEKPDKWALSSLLCGAGGLLCVFFPFLGLPLSVAAIVLGVQGLKSLSRKGMAIAGLVMGVLALILNLVIVGLAIHYAMNPSKLDELRQWLENAAGDLRLR